MAILSVDPSSTRTGWAVLGEEGELIDSGAIRTSSRVAVVTRMQPVIERLIEIGQEFQCHTAVIEIASGKPAKKTRGFRGNGLALYGMAVGQVYQAIYLAGLETHGIDEREWTGSSQKELRAARVAELFPNSYDLHADKGLDEADAIGLGLWWLRRRALAASS